MTQTYDAIVVGARCAGAPTGMLLARKGYKVLVVDRATFPSDTLSTHMIHAPGVAALKRWGLLDQVIATGCPPVDTYSFNFGMFTIAGSPRPSDGNAIGYAPRRTLIDKILVDAASAAGAEVREGFTVEDVIVEDGVVVGIRGPRRRRHVGGRARARRDRCRRPQLPCRQGREARAVQREAESPVELLHVLERTACRRRSRPTSIPTGDGRCSPRTTI